MPSSKRIATISSAALRFCSYVFLRWAPIPALPAIISTLFVVSLPAYFSYYWADAGYKVVEDDVDMVVTDTVDRDKGVVREDVEVVETVYFEQEASRPLRTLVLGVPGPSRLLTLLAVLGNALLVAMTADRLYREHTITAEDLSFVRLGYVSDREAKFVLREPDPAKLPVTLEYRVAAPAPPFESPHWLTGGSVRATDNSTDFTAVLTVPLRHPVQRVYEWRTSNNHSGQFSAAPRAGQAPALFDGRFTFVATSCMVSRMPYSPLDDPLAIPGARHLARVLPSLGAQFVLFLGDFVYVDVPRWWGKTVADYRQKYRQVYASPDWAPMAQNVSWIHVLDDHEIANDWSAKQTGVYHAAVDPYHHYHTAGNPPVARSAVSGNAVRPGATYFSFTQGPASFFLLDTRSYRSSNSLPANSANKTMLGAAQLADLLAFLQRPEPRGVRWKIVASSVPFTKNWRVNTRDTWGGFLAERRAVLEAMWDAGRRGTGVVVLSGDRHEFAATRFPPPAGNASRWPAHVAVHEFSASPLSQFYSPVPSYFQWDDEDVKLRYINGGNSKFGVVTLRPDDGGDDDGSGSGSSRGNVSSTVLEYRLFVDGKQAWNTTLLPPSPMAGEGPEPFLLSFWKRLLGQ